MSLNYLLFTYIKNKIRILHFFLILILFSFPLIASDCDSLLSNNEDIPDKLVGDWRLTIQTGALQDICPDENVNFNSNGVALLTCPQGQTLTREFTISGNELYYTQTALNYEIEFDNNDQELNLYGINVSRNLFYERIAADKSNANNSNDFESNSSINSSDSPEVAK